MTISAFGYHVCCENPIIGASAGASVVFAGLSAYAWNKSKSTPADDKNKQWFKGLAIVCGVAAVAFGALAVAKSFEYKENITYRDEPESCDQLLDSKIDENTGEHVQTYQCSIKRIKTTSSCNAFGDCLQPRHENFAPVNNRTIQVILEEKLEAQAPRIKPCIAFLSGAVVVSACLTYLSRDADNEQTSSRGERVSAPADLIKTRDAVIGNEVGEDAILNLLKDLGLTHKIHVIVD